jgi:putative transposase
VVETETAVGIDVGFDRFATDSDGGVIENPRFFRKAELKIKRASRRLSRCKKGSANRAKARRALAREYEKVANKRADFAHKFSTSVVKEKNTIACETLSLKGMSKTKLAKSVQDAAHREIFRQIEYKARAKNIRHQRRRNQDTPRGRAYREVKRLWSECKTCYGRPFAVKQESRRF